MASGLMQLPVYAGKVPQKLLQTLALSKQRSAKEIVQEMA